ncbi:hypothetical protein JXA34_03890 [Patescibacteria group bacterium]|nr:hypothetical protein [Patescibacteria group bacterium]
MPTSRKSEKSTKSSSKKNNLSVDNMTVTVIMILCTLVVFVSALVYGYCFKQLERVDSLTEEPKRADIRSTSNVVFE